MLEADIEAKCRRYVESLGGKLLKLKPYEVGIPDRLMILPRQLTDPAYVLVEFKRPGEKPSKIQDHRIAELESMGCNVLVVDSFDTFKNRQIWYYI